ncbi:MAG: hypothetical protein ACFFH0_05995 [Promethearchaeota archaeon]
MSDSESNNTGSEESGSDDYDAYIDVDEPSEIKGPPRRRGMGRVRRKSYGSMGSFLVWAAFLVVWLFSFAADFGIFENIAIAIASFVLIGGVNAIIWIPPTAGPGDSAWRVRFSTVSAVLLVAFIVLWLPFFAENFSIYHNVAILLTSALIFVAANAGAWVSVAGDFREDIGRRPTVGIVVGVLWLLFIDYWMWFQAEAYVWEQNVAILILATIIVFLAEIGVFATFRAGHRGEVAGVALVFVWMFCLFVWFWFFAAPFNVYQNLAVVLVSLFIFVAIGMALGRRYWPGIDDMDWKDDE